MNKTEEIKIQRLTEKIHKLENKSKSMEKPFYQSKKLLVATGSILTVILNNYLDLGISDADATKIIILVASYLTGQGLSDLGKNKK